MYVENCDTGSTLRKAISHIFGRNKLCTRLIPQHVWVHFCRKHYQRSRYRNAQEYAKLQCDLVQKQVRRVQAWSDENKRNGQMGVVQDWSLSMRKREQNRVMDQSKKRPYRDESNDDDDNTLDRAVLNGTAVPEWLRKQCRDGYSTDEIDGIILRLKKEIEENHLVQIPDIEILPNISTDGADEPKLKMPTKRKSSNGPLHKRSQSVGVALQTASSPLMIRQPIQPSYWPAWSTTSFHPADKRQRMLRTASHGERPYPGSLHGVADCSAPCSAGAATRQMDALPYRVSLGQIPQIQESRVEDSYNSIEDGRGSNYRYNVGPLPAPTPQRIASTTTMAHPESNISGIGRSTHYRSVSEYGPFPQNAQFSFPIDGSSSQASFTPNYNHSGPPNPLSQLPIHTQGVSQPQNSNEFLSPNYYNPPVPFEQRHSRHQSTPNAALSPIPRGPVPTYNLHGPYHLNTHHGAPPEVGHPPPTVNNQLQYSSGQPEFYAPSPQYPESQQTRGRYSERR
jgi:hypothetical protein